MKKELSNHIDGYRETGDYWNILLKNQSDALTRSRNYQLESDSVINGTFGTNVWVLFDLVERLKSEMTQYEE